MAEARAALLRPTLPPAVNDARCGGCSPADICQPAALAGKERRARLAASLFRPDEE